MIRNKQELSFYIMADMMMNRGKFKWTIKDRIKNLLIPDYFMQYLKSMRYVAYLSANQRITPPLHSLTFLYHFLRYRKLGIKLGYSIGANVFGYGLVIPHHGTIVVGSSNTIGNYAVLHTSTCITDNAKKIGDGLYLSTGAKITSEITLGNNIAIGANSLVNQSFASNLMIAGCPATIKKKASAWYERAGENYSSRVKAVEELKIKMNL